MAKSKYTKSYHREYAGVKYDEAISNRFEEFIWNYLEKAVLKDIFKRYLHGNKKIKYLDFACGTGRVLSLFVNELNIKDATGIDTAEPMVKQARKRVKARFIIGNIIENKKLIKEKFDLITSFRLFLNLEEENRKKILIALKDILKDNGILVINNHMNRFSIIGFQFWIRRLLGAKLKRDIGKKGIINIMSEFEINGTLKKCGYRIIKVYRFTLFPGRKKIIILPERILKKVEIFFSKMPLINLFTKDQIFICTKK